MNIEKTLDNISKVTPVIIFISASITFMLLTMFKADYYHGVIAQRWTRGVGFTALLIASVTEITRFTLLILTYADFKKGNHRGGWLGLVISLSLVWYDITSASAVSLLWTGEITENIGTIVKDLIIFLSVLAFGLEFRLILSESNKDDKDDKDDKNFRYSDLD
jgi:hypothetical protein